MRCVWILGALAMSVAAAPAAPPEHELQGGKWVPVAPPAMGTPAGELSLIRAQLDARQPAEALKTAEGLVKKYPSAPECEEAMLLAGEAEMARDRYFQAFERFEEQIKRYPNGRLLERVLLREFAVAEAFLNGKKRVVAGMLYLPAGDDGVDILTRIAEHAPRTVSAERALLRIGEYYDAKARYAEAALAYDQYLQQFGKSKGAAAAMLKAARATLNHYQGPERDETPLLEARQRFKAFRERYPEAAAAADVERVLADIEGRRALRTYDAARFYEKVHQPPTAGYYYRALAAEHPQDPLAKDARAALIRLGPAASPPPTAMAPPPAPAAGAGKGTAAVGDDESRSGK